MVSPKIYKSKFMAKLAGKRHLKKQRGYVSKGFKVKKHKNGYYPEFYGGKYT